MIDTSDMGLIELAQSAASELRNARGLVLKLKVQLQAARNEVEYLRAAPVRQVRLESAAEMVLPQDIAGCYAVIGSLMQERAGG